MKSFCFPTYQDFIQDFDFKYSILLGAGTFGKVYKAQSKRPITSSQCSDYAIKIIETLKYQTYELALKELQLNNLINIHPNVIHVDRVYAWVEEVPVQKYVLVFVMDLALGNLKSDLSDRIKANQCYSGLYRYRIYYSKDQEILSIMNQSLETFEYLVREKHLYHRDIKPENILISNKTPIKIKIADFGVSKALQEQKMTLAMQNTLVGTPLYLSPTLLYAYMNGIANIQHHLEKSDVFSLGLTFLQIISLLPDRKITKLNDASSFNPVTGEMEDASQNPTLIKNCPSYIRLKKVIEQIQNPLFKKLMQGMLEFDEKSRFSFKDCLKLLNPESMERKMDEFQIVTRVKKYDITFPCVKSYSDNNSHLQLNFLGVVKNLEAQEITQLIALSKNMFCYCQRQKLMIRDIDGTLIYQLNKGRIQYSKPNFIDIKFITYLEIANSIIGISQINQLIAIGLQQQIYSDFQVQGLNAAEISNFKQMRKELMIYSTKDGGIRFLDFRKGQPSIIKSIQDHQSEITDFLYQDTDKLLVCADKEKSLSIRDLSQEQFSYIKLDQQMDELQLINEQLFAGINKQKVNEVLTFRINKDNRNGLIKLQVHQSYMNGTSIPQSLLYTPDQLMWSTKNEFVILNFYERKYLVKQEVPNSDLVVKNFHDKLHKLIWLQDECLVVGWDGQYFLKIQVIDKRMIKKNQKKKGCCENCLLI